MKKIMIALVVFSLIGLAGSVSAWKINIDACVKDANVEIDADAEDFDEATGLGYWIGTTAGVDGTGKIDIYGSSCRDKLETEVETFGRRCGPCGGGESSIYAGQGLYVVGCLEDCDDACCCPVYTYLATSYASIDGKGEIELESNYIDKHGDQEQELKAHGRGDFMAQMTAQSWDGIYVPPDDYDPLGADHVMGAYGTDVKFCARGETDFDDSDGGSDGEFTAHMSFWDPGCNDCHHPGCGCFPR